MKKKLNFLLSIILILTILICSSVTPASSFEHDQVTSSYAMLLVNLDTNTTVYSQYSDKYWHASYMSELVTFLLLTERVKDPEAIIVSVDEEFIDNLEYSDNCLKKYIGDELTLKDLAAIMLLTSGSDAAYLIADYLGNGSIDAFVAQMNARCKKLGCKLTAFLTPGYCTSKQHYTTCEDLALIYGAIADNELFTEIMSSPTYIPERYGGNKAYAAVTENSIMNPDSPYYFRYVTDGKFAYDKPSGASLVVRTSYKNSHYLFVAIRGKNAAEENVFADARRMTTWAYLNLGDRKVVDTDQPVKQALVRAAWGDYPIDLYADNTAYKTLPNDYDPDKISVKMKIPDELILPLFQGEAVGSAKIMYGKNLLDEVRIVPKHDEGVSLINDLGRFGGYALAKLFPSMPGDSAEPAAEPATKPAATQAPKSQKATKPAQSKPTQKPIVSDVEE